MHALIIMAHGSRRQASNAEIAALANRLRDQLPQFSAVSHAFLELAEPDLRTSAGQLIEDGATTLVVLPYFLVAGRHVAEDIPAQIASLEAAYPQVAVTLLDYFGASTGIDSLLAAQLRKTSRPD